MIPKKVKKKIEKEKTFEYGHDVVLRGQSGEQRIDGNDQEQVKFYSNKNVHASKSNAGLSDLPKGWHARVFGKQ